ncbi:LytR/AlgR family response regulator transcription factor [Desertivirga xinjiangensis]|uniref:LytR/AlgR family response regulator transcription factor n=1 Tax=Desertivirga xinjiangensis TaxID=539206 RepID=UPI00210D1314|nr:LytTR family DNA-binding domain-containing protein [Pedobacter xinjiangensis]
MNTYPKPISNPINQPIDHDPANPLSKSLNKPLFHIAFWLIFMLYELLILHFTGGSFYFFPDIVCNYLINIAFCYTTIYCVFRPCWRKKSASLFFLLIILEFVIYILLRRSLALIFEAANLPYYSAGKDLPAFTAFIFYRGGIFFTMGFIYWLFSRYNVTLSKLNELTTLISTKSKPRTRMLESGDTICYIKNGTKRERIDLSLLIYIEGEENYVSLVFSDGTKKLILTSMGAILEELPENFFRIQKSYIINLRYIKLADVGSVVLDGGVKINIGAAYKQELSEIIDGRTLLLGKRK